MTERETSRLVAWSTELHLVHVRLREALDLVRAAASDAHADERATRDLLLWCHGFCTALGGHHQSEDRVLFPALEAAHPHLAPVLRTLQRDHGMIAHLLGGLGAAVERAAGPAELARHLDGVGALLENHFRHEEHALRAVLEVLDLHDDPTDALGPL